MIYPKAWNSGFLFFPIGIVSQFCFLLWITMMRHTYQCYPECRWCQLAFDEDLKEVKASLLEARETEFGS